MCILGKSNSRIKFYLVAFLFIIILLSENFLTAQNNNIKISWLGDQVYRLKSGISWGVPFPESSLKEEDKLQLTNSEGEIMPLQQWPLAYWPDGSIKWMGLSTVSDQSDGKSFSLSAISENKNKKSTDNIIIEQSNDIIKVNTGILQCEIPLHGASIISNLVINDKAVANSGKLICILQHGPEKEFGKQPVKEKYISEVENVSVEQTGPVRAVIKIEGVHKSVSNEEQLFPFVVRLYFYNGLQSIKLVHSFVFNANQEQDFVRGLGIEFDIPMQEELHNRHIRFSGADYHFWDEPVKPLTGGRPLVIDRKNIYATQLTGKRINNRNEFPEKVQFLVDHWASWNDFKLIQSNAEGFIVQKRTNDQSAWINAGAGTRSSGMVFAGDVSGGLGVCLKDFWQSYPSMLEVRNATHDTAQLRVWLWSPDSPPMDMRHYDTLDWGHTLDASYEDVQPEFSTPYGIGRTSELFLFASNKVPDINVLSQVAQIGSQPPLLTVTPGYLHSCAVFGKWSLPDRSSPGKEWVENQLDNAFEYYKLEVEQRNWYGFWDYGDIMHSYDQTRHVWKYDIGGYAWDNTELMPNMWLWYYYLRNGREDIFRMAEAMTRHTSEVDVYHLGRFKGLGSRHNVRHWGCGAKEVRISQAALHRFYYYLTTDERVGDLMHDVTEYANKAIENLDPLRLIMDKSEYPTHARVGPDWFALAGNWMTEWERTGDTIYKNRILTGIKDFEQMPYGLFSGKNGAFGYNPENFHLYQLGKDDIGYIHLSILMGGPEVVFELNDLLKSPAWNKLWLDFCKFWGADESDIEKEFGIKTNLGDTNSWSARLHAYYSFVTNDTIFASKAWGELLEQRRRQRSKPFFTMEHYDNPDSLEPLYEIKYISTNFTAQWCLNAMELLELVPDNIPLEEIKDFQNE